MSWPVERGSGVVASPPVVNGPVAKVIAGLKYIVGMLFALALIGTLEEL